MNNNKTDVKLLYKLLVQLMSVALGQNKILDGYINTIMRQLKMAVPMESLQNDLLALSKALDHHLRQKDAKTNTDDTRATPPVVCVKHLHTLLCSIDVPDKFKQRADIIQDKLIRSQQGEVFENLVQSTVALILEINQYFLSEQVDTEKFLDNITTQLRLLDSMTQQASASTIENHSSHTEFNKTIATQIEKIKNSTSNAHDLQILQQNITLHIQELTSNIQSHQANTDQRLQETQQQLSQMSAKLKKLESEANILRESLKQAHDQAYIDPLTKLPNRLAYDERFNAEFKNCKRYKHALSVLVWDIDYFKTVNDTYGHKAGDKILEVVAQLIQKNCRETDFVARYGGEEFVMLLPNSSAEQAWIVAEKIRQLIAESRFNYKDETLHITISGGLSDYQPGDKQPDELFERADQALYQAKKKGRNCCVIYGK